MMNIGIMPHTGKEAAMKLAVEVIKYLQGRHAEIWLEKHTAALLGFPELGQAMELLNAVDLLLVLGGDGTILNAARISSEAGVPILGINMGHLGFLTELEADDIWRALDQILQGAFFIEERMLLDASVYRGEQMVARYRALNDAVINRGTFARIIQLSTYVDGQPVVDYSADGLIISTATGSTAYSLSAGGPIIEPQLECLVVTPICPHTIAARSIVVRPEVTVEVVVHASHKDVMLTIDGQLGFPLCSGDRIKVVRGKRPARFAKLGGRDFFKILNSRLNKPLGREEM